MAIKTFKTECLNTYVDDLNSQYKTLRAREHSYRPALKNLLQTLLPSMVVTNEPAHIDCGAPDYIIQRAKDNLPMFFVEAKDINDKDLDGRNSKVHKEQFDRYKHALDYIIFTDYLDFHLYEHGELAGSVRIAEVKTNGIVGVKGAEDKFLNLIQHLASIAIQRVSSAKQLSKLMAGKARLLANIIENALNEDSHSYDNETLQGQYQAFKNILIQELKKSEFADIYAQTIAYGMFAARLHDDTPEDFSREEAAKLIPKTNPFLRQIFNNIAGIDLDSRIAWVVDDLALVFQATDLRKIMANYSTNKLHHDPMIHFYEDFLSEYDSKLRKAKGVWYTPQPVVGFIVRAVDEILQKEFGLQDGIADYSKIEKDFAIEQSRDGRTADGMKHEKRSIHKVQILDPATGTGTFLAEVVNQIYDRFRNQQGVWQQYVEQHLLPRLNGFEILMASYAVAHLKLDMLLSETGYQHKTDKRLNVYLTNSLEESNNEPRTLFARWLSFEATMANNIKRETPVMVMIGNPPYSISSQNNGKWITNLIADYKKNLNERNIQPLSDDYIKFIRLGQYYVNRTGEGVLAFISNNSFVEGVIHRQMRKSLLDTFDKIYILDLHGNGRKHEMAPDGGKDENVFDILQGVSINIFIKTGKKAKGEQTPVYHYDLYGTRQYKYDALDSLSWNDNVWSSCAPKAPNFLFVPKDESSIIAYSEGFKIDELFLLCSSGITTSNDDLLMDFSLDGLKQKLEDNNIKAKDEYYYKVSYKPFDVRYYYLEPKYALRSRPKLIANFKKDNLAFHWRRTAENAATWQHVFVSHYPSEGNFHSARSYCTPLYIYNNGDKFINYDEAIVNKIEQKLGCHITSEELFDYIYAVLHSPDYRERYKDFLKTDFPRIPYPKDKEKFDKLVEKGTALRKLHLMDGLPRQNDVSFPVSGSLQVEFYRWKQNRVYINEEQYFEGVPESVWNFFIGGYQPAQKWLKDRKNMILDFEDVNHYCAIIDVLQQTERIMSEIDEII